MAITQNLAEIARGEQDLLIKNLRKLMQKEQVSEAELSRRTQIPQATLHKILSGKTEDPRFSTLKILSDFFRVSIEILMTGNDIQRGESGTAIQSIPVISWKECIKAASFMKELTPENWGSWVVTEFIAPDAYALSTKPSFAPRFPKNTILFIDPNIKPEDGDHVVVLYPNTDEATLREFSLDGPTQLLLPINPNCETVKMSKNIKILGVLIKSSFSY